MRFRRGDIVKVNFDPTRGHEQGNYRPCLVINSFPLPGDISIVLPITSREKSYPLEVELDDRTKTHGVVLCFQIRAIDLSSRDAVLIERAPNNIVETCSDYVSRLVSEI